MEFKPALLLLGINFVLHPACVEGVELIQKKACLAKRLLC